MMKQKILGCFLALCLSACGLEQYPAGDLPTQARLNAIAVGDAKDKVLRVLGEPATASIPLSDGSSFLIYAQNMKISQAFFDPKEVKRDVYVYYFGKDNRLNAQEHLTLDDKQDVAYDSSVTEVGGQELSIFEQIVQNFGRYNSGAQDSAVRR